MAGEGREGEVVGDDVEGELSSLSLFGTVEEMKGEEKKKREWVERSRSRDGTDESRAESWLASGSRLANWVFAFGLLIGG